MIRLTQIKVPIRHSAEDIKQAAAKQLRVGVGEIREIKPVKRSLDAREKEKIRYIYAADVTLKKEKTEDAVLKRTASPYIMKSKAEPYTFVPTGTCPLKHRPVIAGAGPAGLFAAYFLAKEGYAPLLLERGGDISERVQAVERFWATGELDVSTNVQFGEGGAGTFSDGKLNTMIKERFGRIGLVTELFAAHGAPEEIRYVNKPHIGTDCLRNVIVSMREEIRRMGGEVRFHAALTGFYEEDGKLAGIKINDTEVLPCEVLVLAIGHSARDTFSMLFEKGLHMTQKAFAVGVRIEHEQALINRAQYKEASSLLPPADYKLTHSCQSGRGVYSFCMCPGGFVVNASSEEGHLAVNGMSNHDRGEKNANSAIVVTVTPDDYRTAENSPLDGVKFQRSLEAFSYRQGGGKIPVQLFGDLLRERPSVTIGHITPNTKGAYRLTDLTKGLPSFVTASLKEGILAFDKKIKGFADEEAVLSGIETRTSSPLRIERGESFESSVRGIYPCGEGAGYAGGITSAAVDGIKVYEKIAEKYRRFG